MAQDAGLPAPRRGELRSSESIPALIVRNPHRTHDSVFGALSFIRGAQVLVKGLRFDKPSRSDGAGRRLAGAPKG
jgi:hypothetical protein